MVGDLEEEEKGGGLWREDKGRTPDIRSNKNPFCSRLLAFSLKSRLVLISARTIANHNVK